MTTSRFGQRYSDITAFTVATGFALGAITFVIDSLAVMSGATALQAPVFTTLLAVTLASGLIGAITTRKTSAPSELAEQKGNAAFVFSNSTGTFVTLVSAIAESLRKGKPVEHTGVQFFLDSLHVTDPSQLLWSYVGVLGFLAILSLPLVVIGSTTLAQNSVTPSGLKLVRECSVGLLCFGLAAGTPWDAIPYGAEEAANIWRSFWIALGLLVGVIAITKAISTSVGALISFLAWGVVHLGKNLYSLAISARLRIALRQFAVGAVWVVAGWGISWATLRVVALIADALSAPTDQQSDLYRHLFAALATSAAAAGAALLIVATVIFGVLTWGDIRKRVAVAHRSFAQMLKSAVIAFVSVFVGFRIRLWKWLAAASRLKLKPIRLKLSKFAWPSFKKPLLTKLSRIPSALFGSVAKQGRLFGSRLIPRNPLTKRALAGAAVVVFAASFVPRPALPLIAVDLTLPPPPIVELQIEPVEFDPPPSPSTPTRQGIDIYPASFCELPPGSIDWVFERNDKFEVQLRRCRLPRDIRLGQGALVVIGLSSPEGEPEEENQRALSRGVELAQWMSSRASEDLNLYILNLGVGRRTLPLRAYRDLLGDVEGKRPAAALFIAPSPVDAELLQLDVAYELDRYFRRSGLSDDFTRCALYSFRRVGHASESLQSLDFFDCGAIE
jgi:hypothetical protein